MMPVIRIEVEGMRQQILHAFGQYNEEIEKEVDRQLKQVIENFPFEEYIEHECRGMIEESIRKALMSFFQYGAGAKAIEQAITSALERSFKENKE